MPSGASARKTVYPAKSASVLASRYQLDRAIQEQKAQTLRCRRGENVLRRDALRHDGVTFYRYVL